jgi:uncharacterized protein (DUF2062 family)/trans-aconitate methyltransferase
LSRIKRQRHLCQWVVKAFDHLVKPGEPATRKAAAFAAGVFIGCLPLYGLHLVLSALVARGFGLSLVRIYLGAHINNPLSAPFIIYAELGIGNLILGKPWPTSLPASLSWSYVFSLGLALALGSVALGVALSLLTAFTTLRMARAWEKCPEDVQESEEAARCYLEAGISRWAFARGKLKHDPLYSMLVASPGLVGASRILDLGCGTGLVLARLREHRQGEAQRNPDDSTPGKQNYLGMDASPGRITVANECLGQWGDFQIADITRAAFPPADAIVLADVLHYLPAVTQDAVLERAADSLQPGGVLLLREADAEGGWRFLMIRFSERLRALLRGDWRRRFSYRSRKNWINRLQALGLDISHEPAGAGTPFANILLTARRPTEPVG